MPLVLLVPTAVWMAVGRLAPNGKLAQARLTGWIPSVLVSILILLYSVYSKVGFMDRAVYVGELEEASHLTLTQMWSGAIGTNGSTREPLYLLFLWIVSRFTTSALVLYAAATILCLGVYLYSASRLLPRWLYPDLTYATLAFGFFTAYTSLVLRQGLSMAFLFAAVAAHVDRPDRKMRIVVLVVTAALFHWAAIVFAALLLAWTYMKDPAKPALWLWGTAFLLFITHTSGRLLQPLSGYIPKLGDYTTGNLLDVYTHGTYRLDFLALSVAGASIVIFLPYVSQVPHWFRPVGALYLIFNSVFLLFGFIYYSDRMAAFSWYFIPLLTVAVAALRGVAKSVFVVLGYTVIGFALGPLPWLLHA